MIKCSEDNCQTIPQYARQYETSRSSSRDRAVPEYSQSSSNYEGYPGNRDGAVPGGVSFPGTGGKVREGRGMTATHTAGSSGIQQVSILDLLTTYVVVERTKRKHMRVKNIALTCHGSTLL